MTQKESLSKKKDKTTKIVKKPGIIAYTIYGVALSVQLRCYEKDLSFGASLFIFNAHHGICPLTHNTK